MSTLAEADLSALFHPYTNLVRHPETGPLVITRGEGIRVFDENGKDYIEGLAGLCRSLAVAAMNGVVVEEGGQARLELVRDGS